LSIKLATILLVVGALKFLLKLAFVLVIAGAIAGVVALAKKSSPSGPTSFEEWPDVATNPDAQ
jgi:Na+-translocating ferredoxin:NAD+ oxidoreductase RnfA subunit